MLFQRSAAKTGSSSLHKKASTPYSWHKALFGLQFILLDLRLKCKNQF